MEKFKIKTKMEKEDYRKFLYIATFCRSKVVIPMIVGIALVGSIALNYSTWGLNIVGVILWTVILFVISMSVICFRVERRNKSRITTDNTGAFGSETVLLFYDDRIVIENKEMKSMGELRYDQIYSLLESKDYFLFYINANQATLIRKKDVEDCDSFRNYLKEKFGEKYK